MQYSQVGCHIICQLWPKRECLLYRVVSFPISWPACEQAVFDPTCHYLHMKLMSCEHWCWQKWHNSYMYVTLVLVSIVFMGHLMTTLRNRKGCQATITVLQGTSTIPTYNIVASSLCPIIHVGWLSMAYLSHIIYGTTGCPSNTTYFALDALLSPL